MRESPIAHASADPEERVESSDRRKPAAEFQGVGRGTPDAVTVGYHWEALPSRRPNRENQDPVGRASQVLLVACDVASDSIERSNAFDLWKALLEEVSENALVRSPYFRQVLGLLLVAIRKRDLTDFTAEDLVAFRTVTNILHSPSVVEADARRAAKALAGMRPQLPLLWSADGVGGAEVDPDGLIDELLSRA